MLDVKYQISGLFYTNRLEHTDFHFRIKYKSEPKRAQQIFNYNLKPITEVPKLSQVKMLLESQHFPQEQL